MNLSDPPPMRSYAEWLEANPDIEESEECSDCDGKGIVECYTCRGTGEVECSECGNDRDCDDCDGTGEIKCSGCAGLGNQAHALYEQTRQREEALWRKHITLVTVSK